MNANDLTFMILKVVLAVVTAVVAKFVIPALKAYVSSKRDSEIYLLIETAVKAAEQTITGSGKGSIKKEQVTKLVSEWLSERGIKISSDQLDQMIEECVYMLSH